MAVLEALVTGTPITGLSTTAAQLAGITGTVFAVPVRGGKEVNPLTVQLVFGAAPGNYIYQLFGSLDGTNFSQIGSDITQAASAILTVSINTKFVRLDQVSKANAVTTVGSIMLG